jgi:hypothetical protein
MLVGWRRLLFRHLWLSLFIGVAVTGICKGLQYSPFLHSPTVIVLGPGVDFIARRDLNCHSLLLCNLAALAVDAVIYVFWAFVALVGIDLLRQLKRTAH